MITGLYNQLRIKQYSKDWRFTDLGENIQALDKSALMHWETRYVMNHNTKSAFEFISKQSKCLFATVDDIEWKSLVNFSKESRAIVENLLCPYPVIIGRFQNGQAPVKWVLRPEGRYWEDAEGYGMTPDREEAIYGLIDSQMNVVARFRSISMADEKGYLGWESAVYRMPDNEATTEA